MTGKDGTNVPLHSWYQRGTIQVQGKEDTMNLLDHLQEQGYEPQDATGHSGDWYDLIASGTGSVRVCVYPDDGGRVDIYAFDGHANCEWQASLSGAPEPVIIATVEAAEWRLAAKRGGPVTPAQMAKAR